MSEKRARVSPAFVSPPPEQQVPVDRDSGASSRATSEVFTIKPSSARNNRPYPELLRSTPVKQQGFLRTILRGIRGESSVVDWESLFSPRTCLALWATRQTEKDLRKNKDLYVKTTLRELIIYLVFITVLCISKSLALFDADVIPDEMIRSVTFGMTSTKTYYFTSVLRTIFTERIVYGAGDKPHFNDINDFEDFWEVRKQRRGLQMQPSVCSRCWKVQYSMLCRISNGTMASLSKPINAVIFCLKIRFSAKLDFDNFE